MSELLTVFRTEKKYEVQTVTEYQLADRLTRIAEEDSHNGLEGYMVRSLYFDSIYDNDYFDKVDGLEKRKKIRLRIYDPTDQIVKLELKEKQGSAQLKSSMIITREQALSMIRADYSFLKEKKTPLAERLYITLTEGVYRPACIIEYDRRAYICDTNDIRITIDKNIRVSKKVGDFFAEAIEFIPVLSHPILEVKYNGFLLSYLRYAVNLANLLETALSKYECSRKCIAHL